MQYRLVVADHESMSGIVSALKAHHTLHMPGQPVDDFAFALITPLGTDNYDVACYFCQLFIPVRRVRSLASLDHRPRPVAQDKLGVAIQFVATILVSRKINDNRITRLAHCPDSSL